MSEEDFTEPMQRRAPAPRSIGFRLQIVEGPDQGKVVDVPPGTSQRVLVGQSPACELRLDDRQCSRRHAAFEPRGERLVVTDLDSTNGTFVGDLRVEGAHLLGGERVRCGATVIAVHRLDDARAPLLSGRVAFGRTVGASSAMRRLYPLCEKLAASNVSVVIEGETGTGKEVLAESIHDESTRRDGPFVVFDCTVVAPNLVESTLFGHERGAFTGAETTTPGVFEQANGGTLFIDEIGDLDLPLQAKLLRAIQAGELRRLGGTKSLKFDVRVLAATRRDLDKAVQLGQFRDDLFFRLAVTRIELPPLRQREGDVALLARHLWKVHGGPADGSLELFLERHRGHAWPGNVRELSNAIARHVALGSLATDPMLGGRSSPAPAHAAVPDFLETVLADDAPLAPARQRVIDEFERRYVEKMVQKFGGDTKKAAEASGIARRYFQIIRARSR